VGWSPASGLASATAGTRALAGLWGVLIHWPSVYCTVIEMTF